jgi:hypothetical protein
LEAEKFTVGVHPLQRTTGFDRSEIRLPVKQKLNRISFSIKPFSLTPAGTAGLPAQSLVRTLRNARVAENIENGPVRTVKKWATRK